MSSLIFFTLEDWGQQHSKAGGGGTKTQWIEMKFGFSVIGLGENAVSIDEKLMKLHRERFSYTLLARRSVQRGAIAASLASGPLNGAAPSVLLERKKARSPAFLIVISALVSQRLKVVFGISSMDVSVTLLDGAPRRAVGISRRLEFRPSSQGCAGSLATHQPRNVGLLAEHKQ